MKEYRTIIVVKREIFEKIELYRQFLEKSEFGTDLDRALFVADDSVEDISSAELTHMTTCIYLYGKIGKDEYESYYNLIEEKRKAFQNTAFYMLFCRDSSIGSPYGESEPAEETVNRTFSIEIFENRSEFADELEEELRYIKLLSLALAIAKDNETGDCVEFESYYMNACITPNYKNIYYSIMHSLSTDADKKNEKRRKIALNTEIIKTLKKKRNSKCEGIYGMAEPEGLKIELKPFSSYDSMDTLQRDMEVTYRAICTETEESVARKINIARYALAIEEEFAPEFVEVVNDGSVGFEIIETAQRHQKFMNITEIPPEKEMEDDVKPETLLSRPFMDKSFELFGLRAMFPLAEYFEKSKNEKLSPTFFSFIGFALFFAVISGGLYLLRYFMGGGLNGAGRREAIIMCTAPAVALLLAGLVALLLQGIRRMRCKKFFKSVYKRLSSFLNDTASFLEGIRDYINKYLTVYYNNHIKHSRINSLEEEIVVLDREIDEINKKVSPINRLADIICQLNGERITLPEVSPNRNEGRESLSMRICLERAVVAETEVINPGCVCNTVTPWATRIAYGVGNQSSGGCK